MTIKKTKTTLLLNWKVNPYHAPIFVAKSLGYYKNEGLELAILEPTDPSDITEIVALGNVDIALKAMIHTLAAKAKDFPVVSVGTLLDEPPTGLIALKSSGIASFHDIRGKKVGYIGHFGKKIIDNLAHHAGIPSNEYECVRVGMNVVDAILDGTIDTGIGFVNYQKVELEFRSQEEAIMLRIDELAGLGCCCFCSVLYLVNETFLKKNSPQIEAFLRATKRGAAFTVESPDQAFDAFSNLRPEMSTELNRKIFMRTLPFFSRTLLNVERDWNKVCHYGQDLEIVPTCFSVESCYTNQLIPAGSTPSINPLV